MNQANRQKLEKYRQKYNTLLADQALDLRIEERAEILEVIRAEFNPGYTVMEWCGYCVAEMVKYAFKTMDNELHTSNSPDRA